MSLTNFQVFNMWTYRTINEMVAQQIDLFNAASNNTIILRAGSNTGDYTEETQWKFLSGLVRRRNAYGSGAVTPIDIQMLLDTMVKVAAGTPPVNIDPGMFEWINMNQEEGALMIAKQLAPQMMQDMLNTAVAALAAALRNVAAVNNDVSGGSGGAELMTPANINTTMAKFGDRSAQIAAWVVHSKPMHDYFAQAITNAAQLYTYDTIAVVSDPFGKRFIMSDIPALVVAGSPTDYITLGLVQGAAVIERNSDYTQNIETKNGDENILRTFQAEWSYNLGIKGFAWDKTNGGKSPTTSALSTGTNWDQYATSIKDLAGVVLRTQ
jgi:hypothetical protein